MTRLELQLTKAERVQERGSRLTRRLAPLRSFKPSPASSLGFAAAAAVLVAIAVGAIALTRGGDDERVVGHRPAVVARIPLSPDPAARCLAACDLFGPYMALTPGFGSVWIGGVEHADVVRVDIGTRRVVERIPVGKNPSDIVTTADAVWVVTNASDTSSSLVRIDPESNRVTDRIPVRRVSIVPAPKLLGDDRALWLLGADVGIRIDPRRGAVAGQVTWNFPSGAFAKSFGLAGDDLWVRAEDGRLLRYDVHTGARTGQASGPPGVADLAVIPGAGVIVGTRDGALTRIDGSSGRVRWTTRIAEVQRSGVGSGRTARTIVLTGGTVWALTEPGLGGGSERLTAVDIAGGRTITGTALKDVGADWLKPVLGDLWYVSPEGQAVVVRP